MTRDDLEGIPAATEVLRRIRYMQDDDFVDVTDPELEAATRWLRAAAHSCREGARTIEGVLARRQGGTP